MSDELQIHDPFVIPDELELQHEIERPKWWYAQQLRLAGASWAEVARALGYQNAHSARTQVHSNTGYLPKQTAQELMELDLQRLDMLQLVVWRQARQGDLKAIETVLKIMAMRAKYLGLDRGVSYDDETGAKNVIVIGSDEASYLAAIHQAVTHRQPIEEQT